MQIKKLSFGVGISKASLSSCSRSQLREIVDICTKERLVVLKNRQMSDKRFDEINNIFGIHQPADIWASHAGFPKIFRVTNKEISKGKKGLLSGQEFDWHCDGMFAPDSEECISLWCIEPGTSGGSTEFACGVHAYNNLEDEIKEEIESANIIITNEVSKTYLTKSAYGKLLPYEQLDIDKMSTRNRYFAGGAEGNPYDKKQTSLHYKIKRGEGFKKRIIEKKTTLVRKHPISGMTGLYFPFYYISKIRGLKTPSREKEIFHILLDSYVGPKGQIYKHHWQKGDLILSDQVHSLHRRNTYTGIRELYRTAFWYHTV